MQHFFSDHDPESACCDPQGLLAAALRRCFAPGRTAEDVLLAWLIGLPDDTDPAQAARVALHDYLDTLPCDDPARRRRMRTLLRNIVRYPGSRIVPARRPRASRLC